MFYILYQLSFQMNMNWYYFNNKKNCLTIKEDVYFCQYLFSFCFIFSFIWIIKIQFNDWKLSAWQNFKCSNRVYRNVWLQFVTVLWFFLIQFISFSLTLFYILYFVIYAKLERRKQELLAAPVVSQQQQISKKKFHRIFCHILVGKIWSKYNFQYDKRMVKIFKNSVFFVMKFHIDFSKVFFPNQ